MTLLQLRARAENDVVPQSSDRSFLSCIFHIGFLVRDPAVRRLRSEPEALEPFVSALLASVSLNTSTLVVLDRLALMLLEERMKRW